MGRSVSGVDATDAPEEMPGNTPTATVVPKPPANTATKALPTDSSEDLACSARLDVDLSTLEGGLSFTTPKVTNTTTTTSTTTSTTPLQSKAGNIPRAQASTTAPATVQQQPLRFGQSPQPTGIRYPPGFNPSNVVQRPVRPQRQNNTASSPFVSAAPASAPSSSANGPTTRSLPPSLPIPNSREFTFNVKPNAGTLSPPIAPSFPDTTTQQKEMFLTASHRKRNMAMTPAVTEYEADLTSKDRLKQKEAVKKILESKVRSDWAESWVNDFPPVDVVLKTEDGEEGERARTGGDGVEEEEWAERTDWLSELSSSEDEDETGVVTKPLSRTTTSEERPSFIRRLSSGKASTHTDPFRFENPDSVGEVLKRKIERKKLRRQKRFVDELKENEGLRCFTVRRNVWTGAKIVRRPVTSRPAMAKANGSGSGSGSKGETAVPINGDHADVEIEHENGASGCEVKDEWDDFILDTLIPIPSPLLPPSTPMRKAITPRNHTTIYDKIILGGQTPLCPINLQTVVSSCVEGWKRDGEWPPRSTVENNALMSRRKEVGEAKKSGNGGTWRKSLSKVFGARGSGGPV